MAFRVHMSLRKIIAVAAVLGASALTSAWVFYADDRRPSHSTMIGTLVVELPEGGGSGTAVLVDECGILTNFHVVFGPWYVTALRPASHDFSAAFTLTEATLSDGTHPAASATPVVWGNYAGPDRLWRTPEEDWAYLVLDRCLGHEFGYYTLQLPRLDDEISETDTFTAIGYSAGIQMVDPSCSIHSEATVDGTVWRHDCALLPGDSGGPIIRRGTQVIAALASSFLAKPDRSTCVPAHTGDEGSSLTQWDSECANMAVPLSYGIVERVRAAQTALTVQWALSELGYDSGPSGAIDDPRATEAIIQVQRDMGWPETGEPTDGLAKILILRLPTS